MLISDALSGPFRTGRSFLCEAFTAATWQCLPHLESFEEQTTARFLVEWKQQSDIRRRKVSHRVGAGNADSPAIERGSAENVDQTRQTVALRLSSILNHVIFFSLLGLIFLSAVPYGTVEPWWKAIFVCFVFVLWILGAIESVLRPPREKVDRQLLLPLFALVALALIQSLPIGVRSNPAIPYPTWTAISADPYQSQFFAVQLLAVTFAGALLARFTDTDRRVSILLHVIIAVAVCSAIFGVLRQTNQHNVGFGLPLLSPGLGYGQFINPNHFALMMEMAFGLILGMVLGAGSKREWMLVYAALLLIVWTALVLANSRGGLLAMLAQIVVAGLIFTVVVPASKAEGSVSKIWRTLRSLPARILLLIVLLFGVGLGTLWIGGDRLAGRFDDSGGGVSNAETRQGGSRNEIWRATWRRVQVKPHYRGRTWGILGSDSRVP